LQGFPDHFRLSAGGGTEKQQIRAKYKQVGNAVPPPLAAALGAQLRGALQQKEQQQQQQ
jgi:DNA (cytosine-5)-methyltransferase 1